jgi:hypothetical protein
MTRPRSRSHERKRGRKSEPDYCLLAGGVVWDAGGVVAGDFAGGVELVAGGVVWVPACCWPSLAPHMKSAATTTTTAMASVTHPHVGMPLLLPYPGPRVSAMSSS